MIITIVHRNDLTPPPVFYGIWLPGHWENNEWKLGGWLWVDTRSGDSGKRDVYATERKNIAWHIARKCNGKVEIVDDSLRDLENYLAGLEKIEAIHLKGRKHKWHI